MYQVFRIVRKIGIHLEDVLIAASQRPFKAKNISSAKAELAGALCKMYLFGEYCLKLFYNIGSTVRRTVIYDEYMKVPCEGDHFPDDLLGIFFLVVSRNYN